MKLVLIFGPPAVGKMTVGQELSKITGLKLFHNHQSIELVCQYFDFGTPSFDHLVTTIRFEFFKEFSKSNHDGLIFTMVWAFEEKEDEEYVDNIINIFEEVGAQICLVELEAALEIRLERNKHENRLKNKPSKRDVVRSEKVMLHNISKHRMNRLEGEFPNKNFLKINNTNLEAIKVAQKIKTHFNL